MLFLLFKKIVYVMLLDLLREMEATIQGNTEICQKLILINDDLRIANARDTFKTKFKTKLNNNLLMKSEVFI